MKKKLFVIEKDFLKLEAEGQKLAEISRSLKQFIRTVKPCPFGSGLRKFALDPFSKMQEKKFKWWSDLVLSKIWL